MRRYLPIGTLCAVVITSMGGCAVKQPPPASDSLKTVMPPSTVVPPAFKSTAGAPGTVNTSWVETFADPQLQKLVDEGLQNNLDLKAAVARIDHAAGLVVQARSILYPQFSIPATTGIVGRDDVKSRLGAFGSMNWELDLWGRVRAQAASAVAAEQASDADLVFARQSLAASIATLWFNSVATERLRQTAQDATGVYANLLQLVQQRNAVGQVSQQDVQLAGADLDRMRRRERDYATTLQQVERGLEVILGRYPGAELAVTPDLPPLPGPVPEGLPAELLTRRSDLIAAERRVVSAFHLIQVAEAARLPRIALTAAGGTSTSDLLRLAGVPSEFWSFGLDILAPIFTGGALKAQVQIANADQQAAVAMYGQTVLRAFSEVEGALASEQLLADQQRYLESVLAQDTEALRLGRIRYDVGASDLMHVLDLQAKQLNTQFDLIGIRNERLANRVALHLALGGGFPPPARP